MSEILIGVFAWQFTAQCVGNGLSCISENSTLVKKVYFPKIILPLSSTLSNMVYFVLSLIVQFILIFLMVGKAGISSWVFAVPLLVAYHTLFCFALALFLSSLNVFFRDLEHLVGVFTTAWFFMSPAMYSLNLVRDVAETYNMPILAKLYMLNPMAAIITGYRTLILTDTHYPWTSFSVISWVIPILFLAGAYLLFRKLENYFADVY